MSELKDLSAQYCPVCGNPVQNAQATVAESSFVADAQESYEAAGKHVVIDGAQVSVYVHGEKGDSS